jgi:hypothetical protein
MNYLRLAIVVLLAVCAQCAYADSISTFYITQATMFMGPNDGSGDNVFFELTGPGLNIVGIGGMACFDWCSGPVSSPDGFPSQIFITAFGIATINGRSYDPDTLSFNSIFSPGGGLNRFTTGSAGGDTFIQFNLISPTNGGWGLNFAYVPAQDGNPAYYIFTDGEFSAQGQTAEPGTVVLMLTGFAGMAAIIKRKAKVRPWRGRVAKREADCREHAIPVRRRSLPEECQKSNF